MRALYFTFGWAFFVTGFIGVFVPVLPTTPFMILALWMFSKSSERFHRWLYHHPHFGSALQKWENHRVIPPIAKVAAVVMICASFFYILLFSQLNGWLCTLIGVFLLYALWFILSKPSTVPDKRLENTGSRHP